MKVLNFGNRFGQAAALVGISVSLVVGLSSTASAQYYQSGKAVLSQIKPPAAVKTATLVGRTPGSTLLHISIGLPSSDPTGFQNAADAVSNPDSPSYQRFLTPAQVGALFGQPTSSVRKVIDYLSANGFKIDLIAPNHMAILAEATVAQAEKAFGTTISDFHAAAPTEFGNQNFHSFVDSIEVPANIGHLIESVGGLESYTKPHALHHKRKQGGSPITVNQTRVLYNTASYYKAGLQGQGRTIAISNFDGFRLSNLPLLYSTYGLPTPTGGVGANVKVVAISGGAGSGNPGAEGDLDIQMVLGAAPLCNFIIYDGGQSDLLGVLTQEATDNLSDVISESYEWGLPDSYMASVHSQHLAMSLQGITYMSAAGDTGTTFRLIYPHIDPEVMSVGGTVATIDSTGKRVDETTWNGGGGGWNTIVEPFNVLPPYQKGNGVPTNLNFRLIPDVALNAAGPNGAYLFVFNGALQGGFDGTSFASPVCAGSLGIAEQKLKLLGALKAFGSGKSRLGRLQDFIYKQNGKASVFFDITTGSNGTLPDGTTSNAKAGWDFATGWGAFDFVGFVNAFPISISSTNGPISASIFNNQGASATGSASNLSLMDGQYFTVNSVPSSLGQIAAAKLGFVVANPSTLSALTINLSGLTTAGTSNFVYLFNYTTNGYDLIYTSPLGNNSVTNSISVNNFSKYISPTGSLTLVDRAVYPARTNPTSFILKLDAVTLGEVF